MPSIHWPNREDAGIASESAWKALVSGNTAQQQWQSTQSTKCMTSTGQEHKWSTPTPTTAKDVHWRPGTSPCRAPASSLQPLDSLGTSTCSLNVASNYSTLVYHCACEWTATTITSYFYHHYCMELRCHYHYCLAHPHPVTFPTIQMYIKHLLLLYDYLFTDEDTGLGGNELYTDNRHLS